jgi:hypothetical protein
MTNLAIALHQAPGMGNSSIREAVATSGHRLAGEGFNVVFWDDALKCIRLSRCNR